MTVLFQLFWSFCKIGFTSFGGLSLVPLINSEMLAHGWMTSTQVSDILAIAEMTPGPNGLNCAIFAGLRVSGIAGALCATLGMLSPTLTLCAAAAFAFARFRDSAFMKRFMTGVRPVCLGLIVGVMFLLVPDNYCAAGSPQPIAAAIGLLDTYLLCRRKAGILPVIVLSALLGLVLCRLTV